MWERVEGQIIIPYLTLVILLFGVLLKKTEEVDDEKGFPHDGNHRLASLTPSKKEVKSPEQNGDM